MPLTALPTTDEFRTPRRGHGPCAFWFLNDALDMAELRRQLEAFAAAGFGSVCPCARIGLDGRVSYLSDAWFAVVRDVVDICAELGLEVVLYDEASYPSGAANGLVVAESPEYAARALVAATVVVEVGPGEIRYARPSLGRGLWDRPLLTVVARQEGGVGLAATAAVIDDDGFGPVRVGADEHGAGRHLVLRLYDVPSGGRIRGAHAWQDDGSALAPAAADLLNPDAVAAFVRLTYDGYGRTLGDRLGRTVTSVFTDEPDVLGRGHRPDGVAWTPGLEREVAAEAGIAAEELWRYLPALVVPWDDDAGVRAAHAIAVAGRLSRVYYGALRSWCDRHGVALTGHPHEPDELRAQESFTWPGQDVVWRWVLPGETAGTGPESTSARSAASAAAVAGAGRSLTEVYGAYGWRLTMDEAKWLLDWHAVRGTTDYVLHALFLSVAGNRAWESEPDLLLHNAWRSEFPELVACAARHTLLARGAPERADVAALVVDDRCPEDAAGLQERQILFHYVPVDAVRPVAGGLLTAGEATYRAAWVAPADRAHPGVEALRRAGIRLEDDVDALADLALPGIRVLAGRRDDLRVLARRRGGVEINAVANDGEQPLVLALDGPRSVWDPWTGDVGRASWLVLGRRELVWLGPDDATLPSVRHVVAGEGGGELAVWTTDGAGGVQGRGDWAAEEPTRTWAGTVTYRAELPREAVDELLLDLGAVGDLARVSVDGGRVASLYWAPYRCLVPVPGRPGGRRTVEVTVTNSSANAREGAQRPSGLMGPVTWRVAREVDGPLAAPADAMIRHVG